MAAPAPLDRVPPTTAAYVIATAIIAGVTGYFIGQGSSLNLFKEKEGWPNSYDVKVHSHSSDEEDESDSEDEETEDEGNGEELSSFKDNNEEVKLVLVVRMDLGMTKGMYSTNVSVIRILCCKRLRSLFLRQNRRPMRSRYPCLLQILP
jgi:PTH2 family peptidyl-tRNA hydrolase